MRLGLHAIGIGTGTRREVIDAVAGRGSCSWQLRSSRVSPTI